MPPANERKRMKSAIAISKLQDGYPNFSLHLRAKAITSVKMKVLNLAIPLCLTSLADATQPVATAYSYGVSSKSIQQPPTIAPLSALLVLAQQMGLDDFYTAAGADETVLQLADSLSESQQRLLTSDDALPLSKAIILVEGVENVPDSLINIKPAFYISSPPNESSNKELLTQFMTQHQILSGKGKSVQIEDDSSCGVINQKISQRLDTETGRAMEEAGMRWHSTLSCHGTDYIGLQFSGIDQLQKSSSSSGELYSAATRILSNIIRDVVDEIPDIVVVVSPPSTKESKAQGYSFHPHHLHLRPRQHRPEALLSDGSEASTPSASSAESSDLPITNGTFKKGVILPFCHATEPILIKATKNCTGHGYPYLKYKSGNEKNKNGTAAVECWSCNCVSTYSLSSDGMNKTTFWSGPACQKKDVSAPFFLIAGFTIFIVGIASWGVGLLFSIGQEDLPGVIGAGVAGPKAK